MAHHRLYHSNCNLEFFITSGSAKWALEAPIFVPMFMQLGYHPAFTQLGYRVADSSFNIMTPLNPYLVVILSFMQKYDKKAGIGTLMSLMIPYSLIFLTVLDHFNCNLLHV